MFKQYKSNSAISLNVVLKGGKSAHVSFTPLSNGSSVYATSNEEIQQALEKHYRFGKLFRLAKQAASAAAPKKGKEEKAAAKEKKEQHVKVADWGKAKDYLAEKTGVSRSKMRSTAQIREVAAANNIVFDGLG